MKRKNKVNNELVEAIINEYKPEIASDVQEALKDVFGPIFEAMLQREMNAHLGYENNSNISLLGTGTSSDSYIPLL